MNDHILYILFIKRSRLYICPAGFPVIVLIILRMNKEILPGSREGSAGRIRLSL
jgi:hypothetical protein